MLFPTTKAERDVDTVTFFPKVIPFPKVGIDDFLRQAATDIITILTHPPSSTTPSLEAGDITRNALLKIANTLNTAEPIPTPTPIPTTTSTNRTSSPRVQDPCTSPTVAPTSTENATAPRVPKDTAYKDRWKKGVQAIPQSRYNLRNRGTNFRGQAARYLLAQHIFKHPTMMHMYDSHGKRLSMDNLINGPQGDTWTRALSNEWGRLAQGNDHGVLATNTIRFIAPSEVPSDRKVTYVSFVCDHRPLKTELWRVMLVVGVD